MVIIANSSGKEIRAMNYRSYDFEVGDSRNDFEISMYTSEYSEIPESGRIYIPDTENGGIYKRLEVDTKYDTVTVGGYTWRGMLQNKVIIPPSGRDYATDYGDINTIIGQRVRYAFGTLFDGAQPLGVNVSYQYVRYCKLYDGLRDMLASVGYKMRIRYDAERKKVIVDAVPITDYSDKIVFSTDMQSNYYMMINQAAVNHLICLGSGELKNRTVVHLYVDMNGKISGKQTFFGSDEIVAVYDYAGADEAQLKQSGTEQLSNMRAINQFSMDFTGRNVDIGDIVGGRDKITGKMLRAPISGKIHKSVDGIETTEYTISDKVEVTEE